MSGFDLPPLMLTNKESEALIVAIRLLTTGWGVAVARTGVCTGESARDPARREPPKGRADADLRPGFWHEKPLPQ